MLPQPAAQRVVAGGRDHDDPRPACSEHPRCLLQDLPCGLSGNARQHDAAHLILRKHRKTVAKPKLSAVFTACMFQRLLCLCQRAGPQVGTDHLRIPARSCQHRCQLAVVAANVRHRLSRPHKLCGSSQTRIQCGQQFMPSL